MEIARAIRMAGSVERLRVSCRDCGAVVFDTADASTSGGPAAIEAAALGSMKVHNQGSFHAEFDVELYEASSRVTQIDVRVSERNGGHGR